MKKIILCILLITSSFALEIDEKLTLRFLDVSNSKKTVLINRGLEDGLVLGDHAKFFITTGVVARGVVIKASPTRSIWSLYRLVSPDKIQKSTVANIKISSEVKLTTDASKSLRSLIAENQLGEPVNIQKGSSLSLSKGDDHKEMAALLDSDSSADLTVRDIQKTYSSSSRHHLEISGLLSMSSLSGVYSSDVEDFDATASSLAFSGALEKYFPSSQSFLKNFSIKGILNKRTDKSGTSSTTTIDQLDIGGGVAYYFGKGPFVRNNFIYFIDGQLGMSNNTITVESKTNSAPLEGGGSFMSFGVGAKYLTSNNFGALGRIDYYKTSISYEIDNGSSIVTHEYALAGPRVMFGLFYRFL